MDNKKRVLICVNRDFVLYNFRIELVERLLYEGYEVFICLPDGPKVQYMVELGCTFVPVKIDKRGTNPFKDIVLIREYTRIFQEISPCVVLLYTTKVCIYGGIVANRLGIPYIINVSGLGTALEKTSLLKPFIMVLYRMACNGSACVFFQNEANRDFFEKYSLFFGNKVLIPGSGVNLSRWKYLEYPKDSASIEFIFIARIIKEKGIEDYLFCANEIKKKYPNAVFHICGPFDADYFSVLDEYERRGIIQYHGEVFDTLDYLKVSHCLVHPSFYAEGISNVCLEAAACGRVVITTNRAGCRETVLDGETGFLFEPTNRKQLVECVERFLNMRNADRERMGMLARCYMQERFDRNIVIREYMKEIGELLCGPENRKKILLLGNSDIVLYNFRLELVEALINEGYEVHLSSPYGERIDRLVNIGAVFHEVRIDRHGLNPWKEVSLFLKYRELFLNIRPDVVLGYTVKPNIYGALLAHKYDIPFVANITGLGIVMQKKNLLQVMVLNLYRVALKNVKKVFFQNDSNRQFFLDNGFDIERQELLPGSGVNVNRFSYQEYPNNREAVRFLFIGRIMKDKGIKELVEAARCVKKNYPKTEVVVVGRIDGDYEEYINRAAREKIITYYEECSDVKEFIKDSHCVVLPSYHEGMSNALLEAASSGRPVIASDVPGCRETFTDGKTGLKCEVGSSDDLSRAMVDFINLPYEEKRDMGIKGREKMIREFDRSIVVEKYLKEIALWV